MTTTDAFQREVRDRLELIKGRYGNRLDDQQLEEVRKGVEAIVRAAGALKAVELENGDEPAWVFTPYREGA